VSSSQLPSPGDVKRMREEWEKRVRGMLGEAVKLTGKVKDVNARRALNLILQVVGDLCWFELERLRLAERELRRHVGEEG